MPRLGMSAATRLFIMVGSALDGLLVWDNERWWWSRIFWAAVCYFEGIEIAGKCFLQRIYLHLLLYAWVLWIVLPRPRVKIRCVCMPIDPIPSLFLLSPASSRS